MNKKIIVATLVLFVLLLAACASKPSPAEDYMRWGNMYMDRKDYDTAIDRYETGLRLYPESEELKAALERAKAAKEAPALAEQQRQQEAQAQAEQQARDAVAGYITLQSGFAGTVLVNGEATQFTVKEDGPASVRIENAAGEYTLAVRDAAGTVHQAENTITVGATGPDNRYSASVINRLPNSGDDFRIRQSAQGGLTITEYTGTRRQVVIPETIDGVRVTEIGLRAFENKNLLSVVIPNTVTAIGTVAFRRNTLSSVTIPNSVTAIDSGAFMNCGIETLTLGSRVSAIGEGAFYRNNITELSLPSSIRTIGIGAFAINNFSTLTIPNGITSLGRGSFTNCPLTAVTLPSTLTNFRDAFASYEFGSFLVEDYGKGYFDAVYETPYGNSITRITLPANVDNSSLAGNFGENFVNFYQSQNRKAGTYTYNGRIWSVDASVVTNH